MFVTFGVQSVGDTPKHKKLSLSAVVLSKLDRVQAKLPVRRFIYLTSISQPREWMYFVFRFS